MVSTIPSSKILSNNSAISLTFNYKFHISFKTYDNKSCYYIKLGENEAYIDRKTGITLYEKTNTTESKLKYELDVVTDADIRKPDISLYNNT